jgi:hypothetical protein
VGAYDKLSQTGFPGAAWVYARSNGVWSHLPGRIKNRQNRDRRFERFEAVT